MLRIVHFGKYYFPDRGGVESVTSILAKGCVAAGDDVKVVCFGKLPQKKPEIFDGVEVSRHLSVGNFFSQPFSIKYFLDCLHSGNQADIVHLHLPNMLGALCALFLNRKTKLLAHWHSDVVNKGPWGKLVRPLEKAVLMRADRIAVSTLQYAESSSVISKYMHKVVIAPYGIPESTQGLYDSSKIIPLNLRSSISGKKLILATARLVPYKGINILIDAARHIDYDAAVVIVGTGPLKSILAEMIIQLKLTERVFLAGELGNGELNALFHRADLFCLPSLDRAEAFGVVQLEAMSHGVPVVATNISGSGVPWVNQHGVTGLNVEVGDSEALALACNRILRDPDFRKQLSKGARQRYLEHFQAEKSVREIKAIYETMISDPARQPIG